jgi:lipoprotein-releasing system permease protein
VQGIRKVRLAAAREGLPEGYRGGTTPIPPIHDDDLARLRKLGIGEIDGLEPDALRDELSRGARFVVYPYLFSVGVLTFLRRSRVYFVRAGERGTRQAVPYVLVSILGLLGIPFGLFYTPLYMTRALLGGIDVTQKILPFVAARGAEGFVIPRARDWSAWFWWVGGLFGLCFAALSTLALAKPRTSTEAFQLKVEIVRYGALGVGVVFLVFVLVAALPLGLDLLEKRSFISFVGARHVRATKSGFLTVISILSILGVSLSSCALCSVTSIMGGFGHDLKRKILGNNAHIVIDTTKVGGVNGWEDTLAGVRVAIGSKGGAATPVVAGDAMGSSNSNTAGVLVRGIDPGTIGQVIDLPENIKFENGGVGRWEYLLDPEKLTNLPPDEVVGRTPAGEPIRRDPGFQFLEPSVQDQAVRDALKNPLPVRPAIILGKELAKSLHVYVGEEITLLSPMGELGPMGLMPRTRKFRVAAIFYSGMYEYDASHAYIDLKVAQEFFSLDGKISQIDVRVAEPEKVGELRPAIEKAVADSRNVVLPDGAPPLVPLRLRDWMEMNKNLFSALKLERIATFIILSIAIAVASFCIICTLLLMVTEKGKQIAILKAVGASDGAIMRIFMLEGIIIGAIGTVFGVGTALASCTGLKWFGVRLDPEVYYIDRLPVNVDLKDYGLVALAAMVICTLSTIYPALAASKLSPVDGLRHE